jgi:DNA polymerase-3 subunit epsilon
MIKESIPVFIDCQSTGASIATSELLEIGWNHESWVIQQDVPVKPKILKLIGISESEIVTGITKQELLTILNARIEAENPPFAVAHYARLEKSYLDRLWQDFSGKDFPIPIVCTHQIAKRLFPNLPSFGLKALAGWFAMPLPEGKRARGHVDATREIWQKLLCELQAKGIVSLDDVRTLCQTKATKPKGAKDFLIPREKRLKLPDCPGIYKYLDRSGRILYVGKATSLKQRVNSYFTGGCSRDYRKREMLAQAVDLEVVPLELPLNAGLLEFDEIRRLKPPYNIALTGSTQNPLTSLDILLSPVEDLNNPALSKSLRDNFHGLEDIASLQSTLLEWRCLHGFFPQGSLPVRRLLNLGIPLVREWIRDEAERRAAALLKTEDESDVMDDAGIACDEESEQEVEEVEFVWTPELMAGQIPKILRRATRHYLRLKWWKRLSEATIQLEVKSPLNRNKSARGTTVSQTVPRIIVGADDSFDPSDPQRTKILLHELRRAEAKGASWKIIKPWPMKVPFWI